MTISPLARALTLRALAFAVMAVLPIGLLLGLAADEADPRLDARLAKLVERSKAPTGDQEKLRQEILGFRKAGLGTSYEVRANILLASLPSALDRLEPKNIPAIEKFNWHPKEMVALLGEHRGRHGGQVTCVAASQDSSMLASGGNNYVRIWDPATMRLKGLAVANWYHYGVLCIAFSRDGKTIVAGTTSGFLYGWDLPAKDYVCIQRFMISSASTPLNGLSFSPDGKMLAVACADNAVRLYDMTPKEPKEKATLLGFDKPVTCVAYAPDGKHVAAGSNDTSIRVWNVTGENPKEKAVLQSHLKEVTAIAFNPASTSLASASVDGSMRLWTMPPATAKPRERTAFQATGATAVHGLAFSGTGNTLASTCGDGTIRLWGAAQNPPKERFKLEGHVTMQASGVAYSPDNKILITGGHDWMCRTWDITGTAKPKERFMPAAHLGYVYSCAFSPDAQTLATASVDKVCRLWDMTKADTKTRTFIKGEPPVALYKVAFSPDGKAVATGGVHTTARQYDSQTGRPLRHFVGNPGYVDQLTYSPDGQYVAISCQSQNDIMIFEAQTGREIRRLLGHEVPINCLAFSTDGKQLASGSGTYLRDKMGKIVLDKNNNYVYKDTTLRLWEVDSGKEQAVVKSHTMPLYSLGFSADNKTLFSGAYEAVVRKRALADPTNTESPACKGASGYSYQMAVAPDGKTVLTAGIDYRLIEWDAATGKRLREWALPESISSLSLASDSRHIAVGLQTGVVLVLRLRGQEAPIK